MGERKGLPPSPPSPTDSSRQGRVLPISFSYKSASVEHKNKGRVPDIVYITDISEVQSIWEGPTDIVFYSKIVSTGSSDISPFVTY